MRRLPLVLVGLLAVTLAPAASSSTAKTITLSTRGYVTSLAADGSRVAAAIDSSSSAFGCYHVFIWAPAKKSVSQIPTASLCPPDGAINDLSEIALAGKSALWLEDVGGNYLELGLFEHTLGVKKTQWVADASNGNGAAEDSSGDYIANLSGDGNLLVFNSWSECTAVPVGWEGGQTCAQPAPGDQPITIFSNQKLMKVVNGKAVQVASAPDVQNPVRMSLTAVAVDAGRIVTQDSSGQMTLYSATGAILAQIPVPNGTFAGTALQGTQLVTLRNGSLELYDVTSGSLLKTIPLAAGSVLRDLQSGLAVYVHGRKIHVLRLSDGRDVCYSPSGKGSVDAQIEASGLLYSYNLKAAKSHGRIVFVPFAGLLRKLG